VKRPCAVCSEEFPEEDMFIVIGEPNEFLCENCYSEYQEDLEAQENL